MEFKTEKQSLMEFNDKSGINMDKNKTVGCVLAALTQCLGRVVTGEATLPGLPVSGKNNKTRE